MNEDTAACPVLCETCHIEWDPDDLDQVQPDGHYVCPLWTGEDDEHQLNVQCTRCLDRHDPAETGNPMCGLCLDGHLAEYLAGLDITDCSGLA